MPALAALPPAGLESAERVSTLKPPGASRVVDRQRAHPGIVAANLCSVGSEIAIAVAVAVAVAVATVNWRGR